MGYRLAQQPSINLFLPGPDPEGESQFYSWNAGMTTYKQTQSVFVQYTKRRCAMSLLAHLSYQGRAITINPNLTWPNPAILTEIT